MKCTDCNYYWKADGERYARCHCEETAFAPCEEEEYDTPDVEEDEDVETEDIDKEDYDYTEEIEEEWDDADDECGFDPYLGCYTDDC